MCKKYLFMAFFLMKFKQSNILLLYMEHKIQNVLSQFCKTLKSNNE